MERNCQPPRPTPAGLATVPWLIMLPLVACLVLTLPLGATTLTPMTGEDLALAADRVVVAQCTETASRWYGRALVTELTFAVSETLVGEESGELVVAVPGGVDLEKGIAVTLPGAPSLAPGQDYLLFLHQLPDTDRLGVVGLSQGAFPIVYHQGQAMVSQSPTKREGALGLEHVKTRIRSYLHARDAQR